MPRCKGRISSKQCQARLVAAFGFRRVWAATRWHKSMIELSTCEPRHAESSLNAKIHPIVMRVDEMAEVEGRFSPAPIRGRLQGDLSGVGPAQETAGAPHGSTAGPCTVPLDWCSFGFYERKFSRASDGHVLGPAVPQALPTRPPRRSALTSTSCSFEFASATYGIL